MRRAYRRPPHRAPHAPALGLSLLILGERTPIFAVELLFGFACGFACLLRGRFLERLLLLLVQVAELAENLLRGPPRRIPSSTSLTQQAGLHLLAEVVALCAAGRRRLEDLQVHPEGRCHRPHTWYS